MAAAAGRAMSLRALRRRILANVHHVMFACGKAQSRALTLRLALCDFA